MRDIAETSKYLIVINKLSRNHLKYLKDLDGDSLFPVRLVQPFVVNGAYLNSYQHILLTEKRSVQKESLEAESQVE